MSVPHPGLAAPTDGLPYLTKALDGLSWFTKSLIARGATAYTRAECLAVLEELAGLTPELRRRVLSVFPPAMLRALAEEWWWQARGGQVEPDSAADGKPWRIWAIVAGRGFGKTRAGAEWVWARARGDSLSGCPPSQLRIALVGPTLDEVARVMVEGESGLLNLARGHERPRWLAGRGLLLFPSGAQAHAFSAERPDKLRGPQHHFAWCDELAVWRHADSTWDNLMMGLRLGTRPRTVVTTTPKPVASLKRILALPRVARTHGRTADNPDNAPDYIGAMEEMYAGTRLARQELEGEMLENFEGALWTRDLIEKARDSHFRAGDSHFHAGDSHFHAPRREATRDGPESDCPHSDRPHTDCPHPRQAGDSHFHAPTGESTRYGPESDCPYPRLTRILIGLDPPASTGGDSCGIVVCGKDGDGVVYALADLTAAGLSPEAWARRVADAAALYGATRVVAEKNQGGDMIASVLRAVDADLPVKLVAATRSKAARAEPIALRFETGRARLAGHFPELEDQLCALTWSGYLGPGSPDRADAMVWAMTELFEKERAEPRIMLL